MYQLIASDLDGTLLSAQHEIPPYSMDVIRQLAASGRQFVFATGRHFVDVCHLQQQLGVPCWMISANGAMVHDDHGQLVYQQVLEPGLLTALLALPSFAQVSVNLYQPERWLTNTPAVMAYSMAKASGFHAHRFSLEQPIVENVIKVFLLGEPQVLQLIEQELLARFPDQLHLSFSLNDCLEIMAPGVSKGHALELVVRAEGLSLAQCMAFGDGMNDLEILSRVGKGLLMGNAHERLKRALPQLEVIGRFDDEAVANYLAQHLL